MTGRFALRAVLCAARFFAGCALVLAPAHAASPGARYEIAGRLDPPGRASVTLFGALSPFRTSTLADGDGAFTFRKIEAGTYTLAAFYPDRGEARQDH